MKGRSEPTRRRLLVLAAHAGVGTWLGCGDDLGGDCTIATEPNAEGPFFLAGSPRRQSLREASILGTPLVVSGRVLDRDCEPISEAVLDFWQADDAGDYDLVGDRLRGHQLSAGDGSFELLSIFPGHYMTGATFRPAHLHLKVSTGPVLLTTQLYFEGDPYNDEDNLIAESLIMPVEDVNGELICNIDLILDAPTT